MSRTIGVLGGGQLGRMLALAGIPLDLAFRFYDPDPHAPAGQIAPCIAAGYDDDISLNAFAASVDLITYEFENVPVKPAEMLARTKPVYPPPAALANSQDRLIEKSFLQGMGIPTARFAAINSTADIAKAIELTGLPAVLKTRRMGYDGKSQSLVKTESELVESVTALGGSGLILESFVPFSAECSLIAVRSATGETCCYPLVQNIHREGILRYSRVPADLAVAEKQQAAEAHAAAILMALDYTGVLVIEYFSVNGELVANEIAPRVHNSGHWSIEGAQTSQFENHLRAIAGLPLGCTGLRGSNAAMLNIIGEIPDMGRVLAVPRAHLHLYGKSPRPGRKLGHITVTANSESELEESVGQLDFVR